MVAVTALLVLASLLGAISDELPTTSYFKFIDLWFLWYLINIFLITLYHIMLDAIKDDDLKILNPPPFHNEEKKVSQITPITIQNAARSEECEKCMAKTIKIDKKGINQIARVLFSNPTFDIGECLSKDFQLLTGLTNLTSVGWLSDVGWCRL